jgi:hypothetical protein
MPRSRCIPTLALIGLVLLAPGPKPARGGSLDTNLSVVVTPQSGGLFSYDYTLSNLSSSTLTVSSFFVDVARLAHLTALSAPSGWDISYPARSPNVSFTSPDPTFDIAPGGTGLFSFTGATGPGLEPYLIRGLDDSNQSVVENTGMIAAPSAPAVPEPSSLLLGALGTLVLLVAGRSR